MGINVSVDAKMVTYVYLTKAWAKVSKMSRVVQKFKETDVESTYSLQRYAWLTIFSIRFGNLTIFDNYSNSALLLIVTS